MFEVFEVFVFFKVYNVYVPFEHELKRFEIYSLQSGFPFTHSRWWFNQIHSGNSHCTPNVITRGWGTPDHELSTSSGDPGYIILILIKQCTLITCHCTFNINYYSSGSTKITCRVTHPNFRPPLYILYHLNSTIQALVSNGWRWSNLVSGQNQVGLLLSFFFLSIVSLIIRGK